MIDLLIILLLVLLRRIIVSWSIILVLNHGKSEWVSSTSMISLLGVKMHAGNCDSLFCYGKACLIVIYATREFFATFRPASEKD